MEPSLRTGETLSPLLTDLYQLTMAYGYWKSGRSEHEAVFNLIFRKNPFRGGYTIACGLSEARRFLLGFRFRGADLEYLSRLKTGTNTPLFEDGFIRYLANLRLRLDVDAVPEGTVMFPNEPILRVQGPILQGQLVETALLNLINFESLIATKASRVCQAAGDDPVIEFGLRRAQGVDGGMTASRAAYIGGCQATSNVLAGQRYGIPVRGTHAHSWVTSFDDELSSFQAYAEALPDNCIFLVDTYNTLDGVRNAIKVGKELQRKGHKLVGIRLDSGDLAYLSVEARKLLDAAGFKDTGILASNDLDEYLIASLKAQGAKINAWGVGTKLVTGYDQPALGGVYKLTAVRVPGSEWQHKMKLSDHAVKVTNPGILQVRRYRVGANMVGDAIYDELQPPRDRVTIVDPTDPTRRKHFETETQFEDLLVPFLRGGGPCGDLPNLEAIRNRVRSQLDMLHPGIKRFENPHSYPAGLEQRLYDTKVRMILKARSQPDKPATPKLTE